MMRDIELLQSEPTLETSAQRVLERLRRGGVRR
ncbi:MAG: hypothetical protein ACI8S6_002378 [Myxococcota bacterium]|jgi:hypothetical protein